MKIYPTTKISEIINENKEAINAIASINSHFLKLKNPILRKILASRVTLADAAKIGGVQIEQMYKVLEEIGFVIDDSKSFAEVKPDGNTYEHLFKEVDMKNIFELDVREMIAAGKDPFNVIMNALKDLPTHRTLKLVNTFEPLPLINILKKKGYAYYTIKEAESLFITYFRNISNKSKLSEIETPISGEVESFDLLLERLKNDLDEIDVRGLEMPAPMIAILQKLETLPPQKGLLVHHKKVPQFLFPELRDRGYLWELKTIDDNNVRLLIVKDDVRG
ncbi:MAG: DUF2249 domain-containing protein [Bacteroidia bacterium]|nr:DUF2249 domain-containing protein [Bacteroidia bacterium]